MPSSGARRPFTIIPDYHRVICKRTSLSPTTIHQSSRLSCNRLQPEDHYSDRLSSNRQRLFTRIPEYYQIILNRTSCYPATIHQSSRDISVVRGHPTSIHPNYLESVYNPNIFVVISGYPKSMQHSSRISTYRQETNIKFPIINCT